MGCSTLKRTKKFGTGLDVIDIKSKGNFVMEQITMILKYALLAKYLLFLKLDS